MKTFIKRIIFINRAPFANLNLEFEENQIVALGGVNGRGKTTILSHITDMFTELAKGNYATTFSSRQNAYYRVSSDLWSIDRSTPSIVYIQFTQNGQLNHYFDYRGTISDLTYHQLSETVPDCPKWQSVANSFSSKQGKFFTDKTETSIRDMFASNVITYFPAYRYEQPGYLNDPYKVGIEFKKSSYFSSELKSPLESISSLNQVLNWTLDVLLDQQYNNQEHKNLFAYINNILRKTLTTKKLGPVRIGVGPRNFGGARIQIVDEKGNSVYPTVFNMSSGELSLFTLFTEILRQADIVSNGKNILTTPGIVLIDEIDKHLHLKLQEKVVSKLLDYFPQIQFIITSHSPFIKMGLERHLSSRATIFDLDNNGQKSFISNMDLYQQVYDLFTQENERFKNQLEEIQKQINSSIKLQVITEGKNSEHIKCAITILAPDLLQEIHIVTGAEGKTGEKQLFNTYEVMKCGKYQTKFLFVWDHDAKKTAESLSPTDSFTPFSFPENPENKKVKRGIENMYPEDLFTEDMYTSTTFTDDYGGVGTLNNFSKNVFLEKIQNLSDPNKFKNFESLIEIIRIAIEKNS